MKRFRPGDRIVSESGAACGQCAACRAEDYAHCRSMRSIGTIGDCWPGAFAEYMLIPAFSAHRVPDNVRSDEAALVEPANIGCSGLARLPLEPGYTLLILGTGAIALGCVARAGAMGAGRVLLAGRRDRKLEIGRQLGADTVINLTWESLPQAVGRECGGGADVVMDTTGAPALFNQALGAVRADDFLILPGFYERPVDGVELDRMIMNGITVFGATGGQRTVPRILSLLEQGSVRLLPMITGCYPFHRVLEAFAAMSEQSDTRVKIMVDFE